MEDILAEILGNKEETQSQEQGQETTAPDEVLDDLGLDEDEGFDSPDDQDSNAIDSDDADNVEKDEPEIKDQSKDWDGEKANLEKRVNDNRASYQREHQARLDAEKRIADLEAKQKEESDDDDDWLSDDSDKQDSKELKEMREQLDTLKKRDDERERVTHADKWNTAAKPLRDEHKDFDKYVDAVADAYDTDTDIQAKFKEMGSTPEAAYKLGKQLEQQEMMKDPEKYKAYLIEEFKKEQGIKKPDTNNDTDDFGELDDNSTPPETNDLDDLDILDSILPKR